MFYYYCHNYYFYINIIRNIKQYVQKEKNNNPPAPLPTNSIPYTLVNHVANTINNKPIPTTSELEINPTRYIENLKTSLSKIPNPLVIKTESSKPKVINDTKKITVKAKQNNKAKVNDNKFNQQYGMKQSQSQGSRKFLVGLLKYIINISINYIFFNILIIIYVLFKNLDYIFYLKIKSLNFNIINYVI